MRKALWCFKVFVNKYLLGCTFLLAQSSIAQLPALKTSVDKKNILIGEQFNYQVEASFPTNAYRLHWLNIPDSINHFEVIQRGKIDSSEANGVLNCKQVITFTSFDSGLNTIPSFIINFDPLRDDTTVNLFTDSLQINVSFSPLDSTKTFHDIKTIIEVKNELPWRFWIAIAVGVLLLAALIIFIILYFRKNKKPEKLFKSKLSPFDEAMQSLNELQSLQLLSKGEVKQFHIRLGEIFKRYISRKMNVNLLTLTSNELLLKLSEEGISKDYISIIANSLRMGDAVKFAKYRPLVNASEDALVNTKRIIEQFNNSTINQSTIT